MDNKIDKINNIITFCKKNGLLQLSQFDNRLDGHKISCWDITANDHECEIYILSKFCGNTAPIIYTLPTQQVISKLSVYYQKTITKVKINKIKSGYNVFIIALYYIVLNHKQELN